MSDKHMNNKREHGKREHGDEGDLRYLDVALEERVGGLTPPDLRHRLLAASEAQRQAAAQRVEDAARLQGPTRPLWVAAAVLVLGLGVLFAVLYFKNIPSGGADDGTDRGTAPIQDRGQDASQDGALVRPTTKAEFLKHLRAVEAISIEVVTTRKHSHSLSRSRESRLEIKDKATVDKLTDLMAKSLKPAVPAGWEWPNVILLH
ncbi:MAG: anti-sigma factor, partial [Planctomycetota bacterium]